MDESLRGSHLERFTFINTEVFESISIISFAFVCHHNSRTSSHLPSPLPALFPSLSAPAVSPRRSPTVFEPIVLIYGSLRTPTIDRFARVTHVSTLLSVIACLCMSISGFLVFTDKTQANVRSFLPPPLHLLSMKH